MEPQTSQVFSLLPIRDIVILPGLVIPVYVSESICQHTVQYALENGKRLFLSTFQTKETMGRNSFAFFSDLPAPYDVFNVGTVAEILQLTLLNDGRSKLLLRGLKRGLIKSLEQKQPFPLVETVSLPLYPEFDGADWERVFEIKTSVNQLLGDKPFLNLESFHYLDDQLNYDDFLKVFCNFYKFSILEGQALLAAENREDILKILEESLVQHEKRQKNLIAGFLPWTQREESLDDFDQESEIDQYKQRLLKSQMPLVPLQECEKHLRRLSKMNSESGEANIIRTYLDRMLDLPWALPTPEPIDLAESQRILDEDHACLKEVKEKILDFLAVQKLNPQAKGPIMCLVGAPGVGKTSIAKSIAKALKRKFIRISVGGLHDESEIRGHRSTYLGASPGRVIQALQKAGTLNALIVLDEIDKMSKNNRGDPASSLLEVLDQEQNHAFSDHYISVPYDLSGIFFLANANDLSQIPYPLRDRLECIEISGYSLEEKLQIAKNYIIPKQKVQTGLQDYEVSFPDETLRNLIEQYSHESGVRELDRSINIIYRRLAKQILLKERKEKAIEIQASDLPDFLGFKFHRPQIVEREPDVGLAYGLAYSQMGGSVIRIESHLVDHETSSLVMTGNLGQVMQESAQTAICFLKTYGETASQEKWKKALHLHIPEGAIPKDGPSAGLALALSFFSVLTDRSLKKAVACTGEINSFGHVTGVGGMKEKILAAIRSQIDTILIPQDNLFELKEFRDLIPSFVTIRGVSHVKELLTDEFFKVSEKKPSLNLVTAENF